MKSMLWLVIAPFIFAWASGGPVEWRRGLGWEGVLCALGLAASTLVSFSSWLGYGIERYPLAYLPYPFLVWSAWRFGQRGATAGILIVAAMSIAEVLRGRGPFIADTEKQSLLLLTEREAWETHWVPTTTFFFESEDTLRELVLQRRRWLNGTT